MKDLDSIYDGVQSYNIVITDSIINAIERTVFTLDTLKFKCHWSRYYTIKGRYFFNQNIYDSATYYFIKSEKNINGCVPLNSYYLYQSWNNLHNQIGEFDECKECIDSAISAASKIENKKYLLNIQTSLGIYYINTFKYYQAIKQLSLVDSLAILEKSKLHQNLALQNISAAYIDMKKYDSALIFLNSLRSRLKLDTKWLGAIDLAHNFGVCFKVLGDIDSAEYWYTKALELARINKLPHKEVLFLQNISQFYEDLDDFENALYAYQAHKILKDSLFGLEKQAIIKEFEIKYNFEKKQEQLKKKKLLAAKTRIRKNRIQYSLVVLVVLLLATVIAVTTKLSISPRLASGLIFIFFILTFEFLLVVLDPWVDSVSNGEVGWKIAINTAIALVLFGIHQVSEKKLKTAILKADR